MASTWILRCVIGVVVIVAAVAIVVPATIYRGKQVAGLSEAEPSPDAADPEGEAEARRKLSKLAKTVAPYSLPYAEDAPPAAIEDDTGQAYKTPLARGIGGLLQATEAVVPQVGEQGMAGQVQRADDLLYAAKQQNRDAIREVNRQIRLRRNSPDLLLITIPGLTCNQLASFQGEGAEPGIDAIAMTGVRQKIAASGSLARQALVTGRTSEEAIRTDASLAGSLYDSGYDTAVIGDCSFWNITGGGALRVSRWVGFREAENAVNRYPEIVWSNGVALKLIANADDKQGHSASKLFESEALAFLKEPTRRPKMLILSLPPAKTQQQLTVAGDMAGRIVAAVARTSRGPQTAVIIVGLPAEDQPDAEQRFPLIVNWPSRLKPNTVAPKSASFEDIFPTLLRLTSSQRRPRILSGHSLLGGWTVK